MWFLKVTRSLVAFYLVSCNARLGKPDVMGEVWLLETTMLWETQSRYREGREGRDKDIERNRKQPTLSPGNKSVKEPNWTFQNQKMPCAEELKPQISGSSVTMPDIFNHLGHLTWSLRPYRAEISCSIMPYRNSDHKTLAMTKWLLLMPLHPGVSY